MVTGHAKGSGLFVDGGGAPESETTALQRRRTAITPAEDLRALLGCELEK